MTENNKETGRIVEDILREIMKIIPTSEVELIHALNKFKFSLHNKAPEVQRGSDCWIPFIDILNLHIPIIKDDWHILIKDILLNKND